MADIRPAWSYKEMSERDFRDICIMGPIVAVEARWEMTGADTSTEWLEVETRSGGTYRLPSNWKCADTFVGRSSNPGLFALTHEGQRMRETLTMIDAWEWDNAAERAEYERLKAKFEGVPT